MFLHVYFISIEWKFTWNPIIKEINENDEKKIASLVDLLESWI